MGYKNLYHKQSELAAGRHAKHADYDEKTGLLVPEYKPPSAKHISDYEDVLHGSLTDRIRDESEAGPDFSAGQRKAAAAERKAAKGIKVAKEQASKK